MIKIFASVGSDHHPFNRLIYLLNVISFMDSNFIIRIQNGYTGAITGRNQYLGFISNEFMIENMINADIIISHAGAGTVSQAHNCGLFPILIPRLIELEEHTDPSQAEFGLEMERLGLAKFLRLPSPIDLYNAIQEVKNKRVVRQGDSTLYKSLNSLFNAYK